MSDTESPTTTDGATSPKDEPIIYRGIVQVKRPTSFPIGSQFGKVGKLWNKHLDEKMVWHIGANDEGFFQHSGYDFKTPEGTSILCGVDGIIVKSGWENENDKKQGFGQRAMIGFEQGGKPYNIFYGHFGAGLIPKGEHAKIGMVLGYSGNTGASSGPHCHVEVRDGSGNSIPIEWV